MRGWVITGLATLAVSLASALAPEITRACSGPVPTFDEATAAARLIAAGEVIASPHDWAYVLDVHEVFRGDVGDTVLMGAPEPSDIALICSHQIEVGDRVVVALRDHTDLGLFSSAVWHLLPDGTVGTIGHEPLAATHEELFARLRLLPDTAMAREEFQGFPLAVGASLVLGAGAALAVYSGRANQSRQSPSRPAGGSSQ
jgi:hypothetical protein